MSSTLLNGFTRFLLFSESLANVQKLVLNSA